GADAVMIGSPLARACEAPGHGYHWGMATFHSSLPRGARVATVQNGTMEEIVQGPAHENDGTFNLMGGLRTSMATCGYQDIAEFNRAELMIAPRGRECGVCSELLPHHVGVEEVRRRQPRGLILSGGPASVYAEGAPRLDPELLELGIPVLGICYGMQALVLTLGGRVEGADVGEFGRSQLTVAQPGRLLAGTPPEQSCWMSHRDTVFAPPPGFTALASSTESPVAALEDVERGLYGIQFHPEDVHTPFGQHILETFLGQICGCERTWSPASIIDEQVAAIRAQVGEGRVICGLSGGVDSSVAALLVHRAVGDQLTCVFVDHGLMRHNEGEQVIAAFR